MQLPVYLVAPVLQTRDYSYFSSHIYFATIQRLNEIYPTDLKTKSTFLKLERIHFFPLEQEMICNTKYTFMEFH